jgi:hypothetical protein
LIKLKKEIKTVLVGVEETRENQKTLCCSWVLSGLALGFGLGQLG